MVINLSHSHSKHKDMAGHGKGSDHAHHAHDHKHMLEDYKKRFIVSLLLTVPILILSPSIQEWFNISLRFPGDSIILLALATAVYLYGGKPFFTGMFKEVRNRQPGMMTLIGVALTVAYLYSAAVTFLLSGRVFFWELATLTDIMLLGHWIEMKSVMGASKALEKLVQALPNVAHVVRDGKIIDVPLQEVKPGDLVLVRPGEKIPVDGVVVEGSSYVNEAFLTGESKPVSKGPGSKVVAASINMEGSLTVKAEKTGKDTYIAQVIELVRRAQESRSRTQDLANRAAKWLTIIALTGGALTTAGWVMAGADLAFAVERAVTVMVITCPHALGLAVPLVVARSTTLAASNGLLIRDRSAFERAKDVDTVVFDKTGTLTKGTFGVTDLHSVADGVTEDEILSLAASVEARSEHPIARAIVHEASRRGVALRNITEFIALPGKGVRAFVDGKEVTVVGENYLREAGIEPPSIGKELAQQGKTVVYVLVDGKLVGVVALADVIRDESREAINALKSMGIEPVMLTGDSEKVASWVARELGIRKYFAGVLPHQKMEVIEELKREGRVVAMVGDGINDAPALVSADVGIAIGAGTDVAIESADIILARDDPRDVTSIIALARKTYKKMVQNLVWATGYNAVAIPLAAGVLYGYGILLPPAVGALLMSISTVIVAINATLLK